MYLSAELLALLFRIRNVPASNLCPEVANSELDFCGFPLFFQKNTRIVP
jgi:hypothetical protein